MLKVQQSLVKIIRSTGQALDVLGTKFECSPYVDKRWLIKLFNLYLLFKYLYCLVQPSVRAVKLGKSIPDLKNVAFVAPSAAVIGKVTIEDNSSVWYGATIRGLQSTISHEAYHIKSLNLLKGM